jgi:hypothetical protein
MLICSERGRMQCEDERGWLALHAHAEDGSAVFGTVFCARCVEREFGPQERDSLED